MKINGIGTGIHAGIGKTKKTNKTSGFQALLESNLDKIDAHEEERQEQSGEQRRPNREAIKLIKDAASMLDRAMQQIHDTGQPNQDLIQSLRSLSHNLDQRSRHDAAGDKVADTIVAVETQRLQNW